MDKIKALIEKMKLEGKQAHEIAEAVALLDESKELKPEQVIAEVRKHLKALEVKESVLGEDKRSKESEDFKAAVSKEVKAQLESMPARVETPEVKAVKSFNFVSGKYENSKGMSEGQKALSDLLCSTAFHDKASAQAISKDIAADWKANADRLNMPDMKTALYSDATTGSYLIPSEVAMDIMELAYAQSVMAALCNKQAVIYNDKIMPLILGGDFAFLANEQAQIGDKTPTIANPTIETAQVGGIYLANNELLRMKGPALVSAFMSQASSKMREFMDLNLVMASKDGSGTDPIDGMLFDANCSYITAIASTALTYDGVIGGLVNDLDKKLATANISFLANRKMRRTIGLLEASAGVPLFRDFIQTGNFAPEGMRFVENAMIPSTYTRSSQEPLTLSP